MLQINSSDKFFKLPLGRCSEKINSLNFFQLPGWRRFCVTSQGVPFSNTFRLLMNFGFFYADPLHLPRPFLIFFHFFKKYTFYFNNDHHPVHHVPGCVDTVPCIALVWTLYGSTTHMFTSRNLRIIHFSTFSSGWNSLSLVQSTAHNLTKLLFYTLVP